MISNTIANIHCRHLYLLVNYCSTNVFRRWSCIRQPAFSNYSLQVPIVVQMWLIAYISIYFYRILNSLQTMVESYENIFPFLQTTQSPTCQNRINDTRKEDELPKYSSFLYGEQFCGDEFSRIQSAPKRHSSEVFGEATDDKFIATNYYKVNKPFILYSARFGVKVKHYFVN